MSKETQKTFRQLKKRSGKVRYPAIATHRSEEGPQKMQVFLEDITEEMASADGGPAARPVATSEPKLSGDPPSGASPLTSRMCVSVLSAN